MRRGFGRFMSESGSAVPADGLIGLDSDRTDASVWSGDELTLIERCLAGDDSAFDELVLQYQDMVFNLSCRLLRDEDEALDLSQEVFLQIYRKLGTFRRDASLRTWIYRIVFTRAKNRQRWWKRRLLEMTALTLDDLESKPAIVADYRLRQEPITPDKVLERKEMNDRLNDAITALPFGHREVLLLKDIEGLSYEEIAATLELPLGTVKSRLARARSSLRARLDPSVFGFLKEV